MLISQIHISTSNASVINIFQGVGSNCLIKDESRALSIVFHSLISFMHYSYYKYVLLLWELIPLRRQECIENISQ